MLPFLPLLWSVLPLFATDDANALIQRLVEAQAQNDRLARQYTYLEETAWFTYDKNGRTHRNRSETHEIVFVEGVEFRKLTLRNGKPLSAREAAQVEQSMRETAADRRKHPSRPPGGQINFGSQHADLGSLPELLTLFDNRLVGEEEVRGRKAWVVESAPRGDHAPASPHEKEVLGFRKKLWIDQAAGVMARMIVTVQGEAVFAAPGSTLAFEFDPVNQKVWEPISIVLEVRRQSGKTVRPWGRTEYRDSRFQKFNVESTITVEPPR